MRNRLPRGWVKTALGEVCLPVATITLEVLSAATGTFTNTAEVSSFETDTNPANNTSTIQTTVTPTTLTFSQWEVQFPSLTDLRSNDTPRE